MARKKLKTQEQKLSDSTNSVVYKICCKDCDAPYSDSYKYLSQRPLIFILIIYIYIYMMH